MLMLPWLIVNDVEDDFLHVEKGNGISDHEDLWFQIQCLDKH